MEQQKTTEMETIVSCQKIPLKEKLFFGAADIYGGGAQALVVSVYLVFLINNGISIAKAGLIVMLAKLWDAISDPLMGIITDNTRTKFGRRRPFLLAGGIMVIVAFALLFMPLYGIKNSTLKFFLYLFSYMFYNTVSTIISVPYSSMSTEISTDINEKTKVNSLRLVFSMVSAGISSLVPIILIERLQEQFLNVTQFSLIMVFVFGSFYGIPLILAAVFCKERAEIPTIKSTFNVKTFLKPLKVKAFVYFLLSYLFAFICLDLITTNIVYFADYGLNLNMSSSILLVVIMLSYAAMVPFLYKLMFKGWAKPKLFKLGIPLYIIGTIGLCMYPSSWTTWPVLCFCVIIGIGMSGCQMIPWILFPDIVDVGELKLKDRITGSFSGIMTFIIKSTSAVAILISSWILGLDAVGFRAPVADYLTGEVTKYPQPSTAVWGLRLVVMIPVIIIITLAFIFSSKIKLTQERSQKIKQFLDLQREGKLIIDALSESDKAQYKAIQKELF